MEMLSSRVGFDDDDCLASDAARDRELIDLTGRLWQLACRRLLGKVSAEDYRHELATLLPGPRSPDAAQRNPGPASPTPDSASGSLRATG